ncbi:ATP-dependent sacrificial sulfur transferase LarE [Clostridiaceae bacterium M8S5]|nr:ATP-dependent sacrificial sulfur transferase LarE [Clostridiaceae bacterium M8S5]
MNIKSKYKELKIDIERMRKVAIAFSGGIDSVFLAKTCSEVLGESVICITINTPLQPRKEINDAINIAKAMKLRHIVIEFTMDDLVDIQTNSKDRCYICKKILFNKIKDIALKHGYSNVLDGSNYDDKDDYRPGMRALKELDIKSPLLKNRLTKQEIRTLAKELEIPIWNKPSMSCLAARIPYDSGITEEKLDMVERAEEYLSNMNLEQLRVRHHGAVARIEVLPEDIPKLLDKSIVLDIIKNIKGVGFKYVCIDMEGYKTGSMNREVGVDQHE